MMAVGRFSGGTGMANVLDVAAYILRAKGPMSAMKLQKLCYYAYGYHLAWEGRQLFPEHFQAWANGPVCPELYRRHRGQLTVEPGDIPGDPDALDKGERESVDLVLEAYGDFTAHQLSVMTHHETPWASARKRAKVGPLAPSKAVLSEADIFEFFDAMASAADDAAEEG
jgi:uncharacterized phage-associated protein